MTDFCSSLRRMTRLSVIVPLAAIVLNASVASAQPSLRSAESFAVLGATTVTNTGLTSVTGDVGVSPGIAITGFPPGVVVGGTIHAGDMVAAQAHADAFVANEGLKAMECLPANDLTGQDLGDVGSLGPGVYCFASSAQLTGTLVLTGAGPWVFQIESTLKTASLSSVVVQDAGTNCSGSNVFWQVGSSATLGTNTVFAGNILAEASATLTTGASVSGSVLAINGAVTMDTNIVSACSSGGVPPDEDECKDHHGKCKCKHHDGDDDGDDDGDHDGHHGDKDHDKDHKDKDRDRDHEKERKGHDSKDKK